MGDEYGIDLHASNGSSGSKDNNEQCNDEFGLNVTTSQPSCSRVRGDAIDNFFSRQFMGKFGDVNEKHSEGMSLENDSVGKPPVLQSGVELITTGAVVGKAEDSRAKLHGTNDCLTAQKKRNISNEIDGTSISGVKRSRVTNDDQQPMVHVVYNSLSRKSKKKLEELLHHWSEWHAQQFSDSEDSNELSESGEETFYPALHVGSDKSATVSFLLDNQVRKKQCKDIVSLNGESVSLYNREYAMALTSVDGASDHKSSLEKLDGSRCFNCGSYNHSLKDCSILRDTIAVQNARKQHQTKKNHSANTRIPTRYYQNSPGGKYDGLKAGVLGAETRTLLGLGDLDPPPWLNRMREIGYPPGYIEEEDQPSGITIYAFEEGEQDEGNPKSEDRKPIKKMTVDFPGINALIPENADQRKWTAVLGPLSLDSSRNRSDYRSNSFSEFNSTGHPPDRMWPGGLPEYSLGVSPPMSGYLSKYNGFDSLSPRSPSVSGHFSDIRRQSPFGHEISPRYSPHSFLPYSSPYSWQPPHAETSSETGAYVGQNHNYRFGSG